MRECDITIETRPALQEKAARAFGLNVPSVLDSLDRSKYATDAEFIDAATQLELNRSSQEYRDTRHRLQMEWESRQEKAQRAAQDEEYKRLRADTVLDYADRKEIDTKAVAAARRDLAAGKIQPSELAQRIEKYADELSEHQKDVKAGNALINSMIRGAWNDAQTAP